MALIASEVAAIATLIDILSQGVERPRVLVLRYPAILMTPNSGERVGLHLDWNALPKLPPERSRAMWLDHGRSRVADEPMVEARHLFEILGSDAFIVDRSKGYAEDAALDLNYPLRFWHRLGQFDLIIDPGTVEHCFNVAQAFDNIDRLLRPGGFVYHQAAATFPNHGFGGISPTIFCDFYHSRGYELGRAKRALQGLDADGFVVALADIDPFESITNVSGPMIVYYAFRKPMKALHRVDSYPTQRRHSPPPRDVVMTDFLKSMRCSVEMDGERLSSTYEGSRMRLWTMPTLQRLARRVIPTWLVPTYVVREERQRRKSQSGVLGTYLRDKFCEKPFVDFEISNNGNVFVCCPNHLPQPIGNVKHAKGGELLNSEMARAVRRSIIDGSFAFCDAQKCPAIMQRRLPKRSDISDPGMLEHIRHNTGIVHAPRHVRLSYDSTCNLWCPSCRKEQIVLKGAAFDEAIRITDQVALPVLKGAKTVMMNGYGDIFSSRICRHLLEGINSTDYPDLKFLFITNGVLLTEQEWSKFPNIHRMVHSIRVSIDAATKPVYDVVRLGGDFDKLRNNLEFIARLRREGTIAEFMISMVVQRENFHEMEAFWQWGKRLGCDFVIYEWLQNWLTYTGADYETRAVHLTANPLHAEYLATVTALRESRKSGGPTISGDLTG